MHSTRNLIKGGGWTVVLVAALLWLPGCGEKRPKGILSEKEFTAVLVDMYLAESKLNTIPINRDSALQLFGPFEKEYLLKKNIPRGVLRETYRYYLNHPIEFEKIYDSVIDSLNLREKRAK